MADHLAAQIESIERVAAVLYLAADDGAVALDFLHNLIGPKGDDVDARASTSVWWRRRRERAGEIVRSNQVVARPSIPQGDQLRRTREAVERAVTEIRLAVATQPPPPADDVWARILQDHEQVDFDRAVEALTVTPLHPKVTAADVEFASATLHRSVSSLSVARSALELLRIRLTK